MTSVVHKSKGHGIFIGPQYSMLPQSLYSNPFHGKPDAVLLFAVWWYHEDQRRLRALARKDLPFRILGCVCKVPRERCHGEIIAGYVNYREVFECPTKFGNE
jgi:hypothetical protein